MRRSIVLLSFCTLFAGAVAQADLDLSDFEADLMEEMGNAYKDLDVVIPARNAASAKIDAEIVRDGLAKTEKYFAGKGVEDAVGWAREAQASTQKILEALERQDFDGALAATRDTKKSCRSCHEAYKPEDE